MKLNKILYDIRESTKEYIDDTEIDDRYLIHLLNIKRAKYLRQELNNMQRITGINTVQTLNVKVEEVSVEECSLDLTCDKLLRTCKKIPDPLQLHTKTGITRVASIDRLSKPFNFVTRDRIVYLNDSPYPNSIYTFLHDDGYLYISSNSQAASFIECISVTGIFEDPTALKNFNICCDCNDNNTEKCFSSESEYPMQPHLLDIIKSEIVNEILRLKQIPEDKENNSND